MALLDQAAQSGALAQGQLEDAQAADTTRGAINRFAKQDNLQSLIAAAVSVIPYVGSSISKAVGPTAKSIPQQQPTPDANNPTAQQSNANPYNGVNHQNSSVVGAFLNGQYSTALHNLFNGDSAPKPGSGGAGADYLKSAAPLGTSGDYSTVDQ